MQCICIGSDHGDFWNSVKNIKLVQIRACTMEDESPPLSSVMLVKYTERNGWEREVWNQFYICKQTVDIVLKAKLLETFIDVFNEALTIHHLDIAHKLLGCGFVPLKSDFILALEFNVSEQSINSAIALTKNQCTHYRDSATHDLEGGEELPHYEQVISFLTKHNICCETEFNWTNKLRLTLQELEYFEDIHSKLYKKFGVRNLAWKINKYLSERNK